LVAPPCGDLRQAHYKMRVKFYNDCSGRSVAGARSGAAAHAIGAEIWCRRPNSPGYAELVPVKARLPVEGERALVLEGEALDVTHADLLQMA
jgi:hypothetical protein